MRISDWSSDVCSSDLVYARVRANSELIPALIEEVLRYNPPVQIIFRHTMEDTELGGVKIPKGSTVMPLLASANRDESKFTDPELFAIDRKIAFPLLRSEEGRVGTDGVGKCRVRGWRCRS